MERRNFLMHVSGLAALSLLPGRNLNLSGADPRIDKIILRAGWSSEKLGDRCYLPALFRMIQRNLQGADLYFWPAVDDPVVIEKLRLSATRFRLVSGEFGSGETETPGHIMTELKDTDLLISAGNIIGAIESNHPPDISLTVPVLRYCMDKGILAGLHSLNLEEGWTDRKDLAGLINELSFVYTNHPVDRKILSSSGVTNKNISFAPDALFYYDMREEYKARQYLDKTGFSGKEYLSVHLNIRELRSGTKKEEEYFNLFRSLIDAWITGTGNAVLIFPEVTGDITALTDRIAGKLPDTVRSKIAVIENLSDPAEILCLIDESRICVGNNPDITKIAVASRVPTIFTGTNNTDPSERSSIWTR
jgi:hypothetical protein